MSGRQHRKVLVNIFQRGGMDGLLAVRPLHDPNLPRLRPKSTLPPPGSSEENALLELDGHFALHPAFKPLWPHFAAGKLAIIHGVGSPETTRSHFDQQEYLETGTPGKKGTPTGWLNRAMAQMRSEGKTPFRAVSMTPALPLALYGSEAALAIPELETFGLRLQGGEPMPEAAQRALLELYQQADSTFLQGIGADSFAALDLLSTTDVNGAAEATVDYPKGCPLGASLRQLARLIKSDVGVEIAWAEYPPADWDTHTNHAGMFAWQAGRFAASVAAFHQDLGKLADDVTILSMSEFGRTVAENGSSGTDHGRATCFFLLGREVAGGKVYGDIPVLEEGNLEDARDLPVTTDFRQVFAEVAAHQLGATDTARLFPGWTGAGMSLFHAQA